VTATLECKHALHIESRGRKLDFIEIAHGRTAQELSLEAKLQADANTVSGLLEHQLKGDISHGDNIRLLAFDNPKAFGYTQ
jgi:hypothetical protein